MGNDTMYGNRFDNEPILMPYQTLAFNGDTFVQDEFLKLRAKFKIEMAVELGSCVGGTTKWLSENFYSVHSIEINETFLEIAKKRCCELQRPPQFYLGSTVDRLAEVLKQCDQKTIIFIDSHWNTLPIFEELKLIKESGILPIIAIHDFKVPDQPSLGFDSYDGIDISFENIKEYIDDIYFSHGYRYDYEYHYNTPETSTEVKRGLIYIYPA